MKARQSVLLLAALLCSVAPVCAMDEAANDEAVNAVEVVMPEADNGDMGMMVAEEGVTPAPQATMAKKPVVAAAPKADVVVEEEVVTPAAVAVEAEEVSGDKNADVRGVFEEMSREEAGDQADEAEHIG